jgi:hypothetical protein
MEEVTMPLPTELNTPPVTKMYLTMISPRNNKTIKHESAFKFILKVS